MAKKNIGRVVAVVPSDSNPFAPGYKVRKVDTGLTCSCMSFRFAVGHIGSATKTCKHLRRLAA